MKKRVLLIMLFLMMLPLFGVSEVEAQNSNLYDGLTIRHELAHEGIVLETFYRTDYVQNNWRITDNKNIEIIMRILEQPEGSTLFMEHMHADCAVFSSTSTYINGITQDSMDDKMHVGEQPGFFISTDYDYNCVFAVEGYSQWLIEGWMFMVGEYGSGAWDTRRLTEEGLIKNGAEGSEFSIVFDLLIKSSTDEYYHTYSFMDAFIVYFNGEFEPNPGGILDASPEEPLVWTDEMTWIAIIIGGIVVVIVILLIVKPWD